jgi:hypothetical protein
MSALLDSYFGDMSFVERKAPVSNMSVRKPSASEVANDIMNNQVSDYDYNDWASLKDSNIVEAFGEVIGTIATFEYDSGISLLENRSDRLSQVEELIKGYLTAWAAKEGYPE